MTNEEKHLVRLALSDVGAWVGCPQRPHNYGKNDAECTECNELWRAHNERIRMKADAISKLQLLVEVKP